MYTIFPSKTGEIISGRVTDNAGNPMTGVLITADPTGGGASVTDTTDARGIYGLAGVQSATQYSITATKNGYSFQSKTGTTATSINNTTTSGNLWGVDFIAEQQGGGSIVPVLNLLLQ